ncbi:hypothetical protein JCM15415_12080 [Methanobacterium movens]
MNKKIIYMNSLAIAFLSLFATLSGLFWKGLYAQDTLSYTSQMMGQDLITLLVAIPLFIISLYLLSKNSLRGKLIWMGTLFYFLYTYLSLTFLASFNALFLVYVALMSLSLFTFLGELLNMDISHIKDNFTPGSIYKITALFFLVVALFLGGMWLKMIIDSLLSGVPPQALEGYTTLVIQALDLGLLVPLAILSAYLLLKKSNWGYLLSSIFLIKASLLGTAILSMILFMGLNGVELDPGQVILFVLLTLGGIFISWSFYSKIKGEYSIA